MSVRPAKTQISLGIRPVWSESSLCAQWVAKDPRFLHADSEDSDQTGQMPRLICVFAGRTHTLLVLSCRGSLLFIASAFLFFSFFFLLKNTLKRGIMHHNQTRWADLSLRWAHTLFVGFVMSRLLYYLLLHLSFFFSPPPPFFLFFFLKNHFETWNYASQPDPLYMALPSRQKMGRAVIFNGQLAWSAGHILFGEPFVFCFFLHKSHPKDQPTSTKLLHNAA